MRRAGLKLFVLGSLAVSILAGATTDFARFRNAPPDRQGPALRLVLNIPSNRLDVFRGDELLKSFPVSVGKPGHETPAGSYRISHIVWNPWWHPPESGWARGKRPQRPGRDNPMGRVKLFFDDLYYIHGTPHVDQLGEPASHGCVRMANADVLEVARLVQEYGRPRGAPDVATLVANPSMTRTVWLGNPVAFQVSYSVAEIRDGRLLIHRDVYGEAKGSVRERVVQTLVQSGYDVGALDRDRLEQLVKRARRTAVAVPVDSLLASGAVASGAGGGT